MPPPGPAAQMARARDPGQILVLDVVQNVHHRVRVRDLGDRLTGKDAIHRQAEDLPLFGSPEIVHHQEPASEQVLAEGADLGIASVPTTPSAWRIPRDCRISARR